MNELRIILVSRKTIPFDSASTQAQSGMPIFPCCIPTTAKSHAGYGQPVYAQASLAKAIFEFVTLKEDTAGF
jgi:DUF1680 family protein